MITGQKISSMGEDTQVSGEEFIPMIDGKQNKKVKVKHLVGNLMNEVNEFNISSLNKKKYANIQAAITDLNTYLSASRKVVGVKCTFEDNASNIKTYFYKGGDFANPTSWKDEIGDINKVLDSINGEIV